MATVGEGPEGLGLLTEDFTCLERGREGAITTPGGDSRPSAWICMNLHAFACSIRKDAAGCFKEGKLKGRRREILNSFLLTFFLKKDIDSCGFYIFIQKSHRLKHSCCHPHGL